MIEEAVHRIRSYFAIAGLKRQQVAKRANISWHAVDQVLSPTGNPKLQSLEALDRLIPRDFVAPTHVESPSRATTVGGCVD